MMKMNLRLATLLIVIAMQYKFAECGKKMDLDGLRDMLKPMSKSCKGKTGVSEDLVKNVQNGVFPRDKNLMCYFKCLSIMLKIMNKQGQITLKQVNHQIDLLVVEDIAVRMKDVTKKCVDRITPLDDPCEYAFELVVCGYNEDPSLYFLP